MEKVQRTRMQKIFRICFYIAGCIVLAAGLRFNTKSGLGVSAVSSVSYAIAEILGKEFGDISFFSYIIFILMQIIIRKKVLEPSILLQLPFSILFTRGLNLFGRLIPDTDNISVQILYMILGVVFTGLGAAMTLDMRLIPNPADGLFQAFSDKTGMPLGRAKNLEDLLCAILTCILGLVFRGHLIGIGIGTILATILIGRVVAVFEIFFGKWCREKAGMPDISTD